MAVVGTRVRGLLVLFSLSTVVVSANNVTNLGKPINVPASQFWDGRDGPWSTFRIEVGTPPQQIRVLPASTQSSTWLVLPEACNNGANKTCSTDRGTIFERHNSSSYQEYGQYSLNTFLEERVGLTAEGGLYGNDTLTLGWAGDGMPTLEHQIIAGILTPNFYIGSLALNPRAMNLTDYNNPIPSLLQSMRNMATPIPSTSWSYTAGSHNLAPKVFGSLVLGGYDSTRFKANQVVFPFGSDISLDFQVAIQEVTTSVTTGSLLNQGIISYIDTLVPDIWLPTETCKKFEEAFGLTWDDRTGLYLMNDTLHQSLLAKNPSVSFKLGPQVSGESVTIDMPYWNFYQTATTAYLGNSSSLYFPLRRAANDSQYVLGRTFLQSAYISADYERNTFNLSQALYPSSSTGSNIVAILPPLNEKAPPGGTPGSSSPKSGLGTGAIAGIAVGGAVVILVVAAVLFILYRRRKNQKTKESHELDDTDVQKNMTHEVSGDQIKYEVGDALRHEVAGDENYKAELYAGDENQKPAEADAANVAEIYEMPAEEPKLHEMAGDHGVRHEMEGKSPLTPKSPALSTVPTARRGTDASESALIPREDISPMSP
ncbi:aspartic peptidase domain-containing protein [Clohesyomyces aquaticus]|uniref:Aspartic peptidase domain-containing protein n=1 Tax=Clohesyomyces aquaticus TaxID=1231657 RepID=A0A1Y2A4E8_9PLEO|nr:aspartic peptidase domain-containing protein [Clohesyomyces aquaticus]